jgi:hypothetical protein
MKVDQAGEMNRGAVSITNGRPKIVKGDVHDVTRVLKEDVKVECTVALTGNRAAHVCRLRVCHHIAVHLWFLSNPSRSCTRHEAITRISAASSHAVLRTPAPGYRPSLVTDAFFGYGIRGTAK